MAKFERAGFRGGVNYYRNFQRNWEITPQLDGAQVETPTRFIAGSRDVVIGGADQAALTAMMSPVVADLRGVVLVDGAGHWVQQERPEETNAALLEFYSLMVSFALLDGWVTVYQWLCFPIYRIARVPRKRFIVVDRHKLEYLNVIEKAHCVYCGHANGVLAYVREVAARTEHYWCPIKHARGVPQPHRWYPQFADFGDAATAWRRDDASWPRRNPHRSAGSVRMTTATPRREWRMNPQVPQKVWCTTSAGCGGSSRSA